MAAVSEREIVGLRGVRNTSELYNINPKYAIAAIV